MTQKHYNFKSLKVFKKFQHFRIQNLYDFLKGIGLLTVGSCKSHTLFPIMQLQSNQSKTSI